MHRSLTPPWRLLWVFGYAGGLACVMAFGLPLHGWALVAAGVLGVLVGGLERHAVEAASHRLRSARSRAEVRRALRSAAARLVDAGNFVVLVGFAVWFTVAGLDPTHGFAPILLFALARDATSLPAYLSLSRAADA